MEILGALLLTALLSFCLRVVYIRGYKAGAKRVLRSWRETLDFREETENAKIP